MHSGYTVLVTGGAGFIGTSLALGIKRHAPQARVIALDNLKRRGSELNLPRLKDGGVSFVHGDVRAPEDLLDTKELDLIIECSAEPSVLAGFDASPRYVIDTNLVGAINCLELARKSGAAMIFLSTSRVYPVPALSAIDLIETDTRFDVAPEQSLPGITEEGVTETFPMQGTRSLYGATKYAAELLITEYAAMYGLRAIINRCGVVAGPWQMGRVDQGIMALWVARHLFGGKLSYIGFGGQGKQVRDMLHVQDLLDLILKQATRIASCHGHTVNVGGGPKNSVSLQELTVLCRTITGCEIPIAASDETRPADIPYYVTNNSKVRQLYDWAPEHTLETIVEDTARWIRDQQETLRPLLG